jgi:DNA polymerase-1
LYEIEQERVEEAKNIIKNVMENLYNFEVPIEVDIGIGKNWMEVH